MFFDETGFGSCPRRMTDYLMQGPNVGKVYAADGRIP
ncbi:MAG: hypothetical protein ACI8WM_001804 [Burkholderiaceae bacterium]